jgi:hypothetical protein
MATVAVFIALGGVSYAAIKLPKNSVGTSQIKNSAVTKNKISTKTISALHGATGPTGPQGRVGPMGPMGPGATSFEAAVPTDGDKHEIRNIEGVLLKSYCNSSVANLSLGSAQNTSTLDASGTANISGFGFDPVDKTATQEFGFVAAGSPAEVDLDLIARNTAVSRSFFRIDAHISTPDCRVWAMVTPSTAG